MERGHGKNRIIKSRRRIQSTKVPCVRRFLVVLFLLALLLVGYTALDVSRPATPPGETIIEVMPGMGTRSIGALLAQHGIIRNQYTFDLWHVLRGGTLKAGEYQFVQEATLPAVYNRIVRGDVYTRSVTIPEGFNLFDIAQAVQDAQLGSKESFLTAASRNVALIADLDPNAKNLEGYLYPDTYRFQRHLSAEQMLAAMVRRFRQASASIGLESGYDLCNLIREAGVMTPLAFLTASPTLEHLKKAQEVGADYLIRKPFTPSTLLEGIERAVAARQKISQAS